MYMNIFANALLPQVLIELVFFFCLWLCKFLCHLVTYIFPYLAFKNIHMSIQMKYLKA